jgi:hypothetical protein
MAADRFVRALRLLADRLSRNGHGSTVTVGPVIRQAIVVSVLGSGAVEIDAGGSGGLARQATDEPLAAQQLVWVVRTDRGDWLVLGSVK